VKLLQVTTPPYISTCPTLRILSHFRPQSEAFHIVTKTQIRLVDFDSQGLKYSTQPTETVQVCQMSSFFSLMVYRRGKPIFYLRRCGVSRVKELGLLELELPTR